MAALLHTTTLFLCFFQSSPLSTYSLQVYTAIVSPEYTHTHSVGFLSRSRALNRKMRGCKLRSYVYWQWGVKARRGITRAACISHFNEKSGTRQKFSLSISSVFCAEYLCMLFSHPILRLICRYII